MLRASLIISLVLAAGFGSAVAVQAQTIIHVTGTRSGPNGTVNFERTRTCENGTCTVTGKETGPGGQTSSFTRTIKKEGR